MRVRPRIVSLAPSHTEILFALGLGEQVTGVTEHCDYPPEVSGKVRIGPFARPDVAKIVSLQPNLVLACGKLHQAYIEELLSAGLNVLDFFPRTLRELLDGMGTLTDIAGAGRTGRELVAVLTERLCRIKEKTMAFAKPRVFLIMFDRPVTTPGPLSCQYDALRLAGASLMAMDKELSFMFVPWERLIEFDPEIIISCGAPPGRPKMKCPGCKVENPPCRRDVAVLMENPYLANTPAVKNKRVYPIPCHCLCRPGPRMFEGIEKLFNLFS